MPPIKACLSEYSSILPKSGVQLCRCFQEVSIVLPDHGSIIVIFIIMGTLDIGAA